MPRGRRLSKHGTLQATDLDGAVAVNLDNVVRSTQSPSTRHLFGGHGDLPPAKAQELERRYIPCWRIVDSETGSDFVGLTKTTNEMGKFEVELSPGEYKLTLSLPKDLNANLTTYVPGTLVGNLKALGHSSDKEKANLIAKRGLPNMYADMRISVQAKKYAIASEYAELDLGTRSEFTKVFSVKERDLPAMLHIKVESHTRVKRLKLVGVLYRREFAVDSQEAGTARNGSMDAQAHANKQQLLSQDGKRLIQAALNSSSGGGSGGVSQQQHQQHQQHQQQQPLAVVAENGIVEETGNGQDYQQSPSTRLDPDVNLRDVLVRFYSKFAPSKLNDIDLVMNHFRGRNDSLIATLETKYGVTFDRRGNAFK